jgi:hypothetical protein
MYMKSVLPDPFWAAACADWLRCTRRNYELVLSGLRQSVCRAGRFHKTDHVAAATGALHAMPLAVAQGAMSSSYCLQLRGSAKHGSSKFQA